MNLSHSRHNLTIGILAGSFIVYLFSQAYLGTFVRFLADDYCHAEIALREGVVGSTLYWYQNWSGRFVNFTLIGMIDLWGRPIAPLIPGIVLTTWLLILTWTGYQICSLLHMKRPALISLSLATLILYAALIGKVNILQSFFWTPGLVGYSIALLWLTLFPGILVNVLQRSISRRSLILMIGISFWGTFLAGGTSEVYDVFQVAVMALMILGFVRFARPHSVIKRRALILLGTAILGAILAFVIMLIAPGNAVRQAALDAPLPLHLVLLRTVLSLFVFIASTIAINDPISILIALIVPAIIFSRLAAFDEKIHLSSKQSRQLLALSGGIMLTLITICIFLPIYSTSAAPDTRLLFIPRFVMICTAVFWGCVIGLGLHENRTENRSTEFRILVFVMTVMVIGPGLSVWTSLTHDAPDYRIFAAEWDHREREIRAASAQGIQNIQVAAFTVDLGKIAGLSVIADDPKKWVNVCAADYYGVQSLIALEFVNE